MGIDYGYSVGYGVVIPDEAILAWGKANLEENLYEEDPGEVLWRMKYPEEIGYDEVGDFMNGGTACILHLKHRSQSFNLYDMDIRVNFFNNEEVWDGERQLLRKFVRDTFDLDSNPGWYAAGTIS